MPVILDKGAAFYRDFGTGRSRGTLTIQLGGNIKRGGLIEKAFGMTLREAIYDFGGGTAIGPAGSRRAGGRAAGAYFPASMLDTPLDYEAFAARRGCWHGGIVVFDDTVDLARQARFAMEFCSIESCGKCTPCRIGSVRGVEIIDRIIAGERRTENLALLNDLCELMLDGSLCAMGGLTPYPVLSAMRHFPAVTSRDPVCKSTGSRCQFREGTKILQAAAAAGVKIPKLCATDSLQPFGSCRLCLVEIEGRRGTPASCTTPVEDGMRVTTQSTKLAKLRRGTMELYISDHPLDCLTCAANGDCELQDMAGAVGLREVRYGYAGANHLKAAKDESNPYFTLTPSKCIVCSRCVRACEEVQGTFALTIDGRGFASKVSAGNKAFWNRNACRAALACRPAPPQRSWRNP